LPQAALARSLNVAALAAGLTCVVIAIAAVWPW